MKLQTLFALVALVIVGTAVHGQSTAFTYQGRLHYQGQPTDGLFDMRFQLFQSLVSGSQVGGTLTPPPVAVSNGLFTVELNFGPGVFTSVGTPALEIAARPNGSAAAYEVLSPRQALNSTPYAIVAGNLSGTLPDAQLSANIARLNANQTFTGNLNFNGVGNVGIGTTTAGEKLEVYGPDATLRLRNANDAIGAFLGDTWASLQLGLYNPSANTNGVIPPNTKRSFFGLNNGGAVGSLLNNFGNPVFRNLLDDGIGNLILDLPSKNSGTLRPGLLFGANTGEGISSQRGTNGPNRYGIDFYTGFLNRLAIANNGNIGVGAPSPEHKLDVDGNLAVRGTLLVDSKNQNDGTDIPGIIFGDYNSFEVISSQRGTNGPNRYGLDFYTGNQRRLSVLNNGNVGIGQTNPQVKLDVNGRIKATEFQLGSAATAGSVLTANASGVGSWQPPAFVARAGDTMSGDLTIANPFDLNFGSNTRQMINLWGTLYGVGVQNNTLYQRSDGGFAWFRRGIHNDNGNNPGTGGTTLMTLDSSGNLAVQATLTVDSVAANKGDSYPCLSFGGGETIASNRDQNNTADRWGLNFFTGGQRRMTIANSGNVGIGTANPQGKLEIGTGNGIVQFIHDDFVPGINLTGGTIPGVMRFRNSLEVWPSRDGSRAGYVDVRDTTGNATIQLNGASGEATVKVVNITGGADIAEPFQVSQQTEIPKGAVVVIDEENPGQVKLSEHAYDTRVAGIVSGANGIKPGLALHQQGTIEGGQNVALTGRVYALADASSEPIKPGDLLTTSGTPGHIMKVSDRERGHGAILGKAMTGLKEGKGMVLVLVSLQ